MRLSQVETPTGRIPELPRTRRYTWSRLALGLLAALLVAAPAVSEPYFQHPLRLRASASLAVDLAQEEAHYLGARDEPGALADEDSSEERETSKKKLFQVHLAAQLPEASVISPVFFEQAPNGFALFSDCNPSHAPPHLIA